jgi:molecular chaperone DnaK
VSEDVKKDVEEKVSALRGILDSGTKEELETKTKELSDALTKVGEAMYQKDQAKPQDGEEAPADNATEEKTEEAKKEEPVEGEVVN